MANNKNCTTCEEAIFCSSWGEYRCKIRKMNISNVDEGAYCGLYTNGKPSTNCHCKVCEEKEENYNND